MEQEVIDRFWSKVNKDGPVHPRLGTRCWLWTACIQKTTGYGLFRTRREGVQLTHRVSWEIAHGSLPMFVRNDPTSLMLRHKCDNRPCCNPEHLETGTARDNAQDCTSRNRHWAQTKPEVAARGEVSGNSKLSAEQVRVIRARRRSGALLRELSIEFNVSQATVSMVCNRKAWAHVP